MHEQDLKIKNSGKNDFIMPITFRKVVLHSFVLTKSLKFSALLVFLTDKKQNGCQKSNLKKDWKHNISQIGGPDQTEYVVKSPPPPRKFFRHKRSYS